MTIPEVAARLRVAPLTVKRYIKAGKLPAYKFGRNVRLKTTEVAKFVDAHQMRNRS